jgi:hypothetical protein
VEFFGKEQGGNVFPGLLERAHGGVLFLAEIAGMDAQTQLKFVSALGANNTDPAGSALFLLRFPKPPGSSPLPAHPHVLALFRPRARKN